MNADGSAGVNADGSVGRLPHLLTIPIVGLCGGILLLLLLLSGEAS